MNNDKAITVINRAIEDWRQARGKGTAFVPSVINSDAILLLLLQRMYSNVTIHNTIILVNNFNERANIIELLTTKGDAENNKEFNHYIENRTIKILTRNYIENNIYNFDANLIVIYKPEEVSVKLIKVISNIKYKMVILTKYINDTNLRNALYEVCPTLSIFNGEELARVRISTPVEETYITVPIIEESILKEYKYYTEYLNTSISIFGSFDMIKQARMGNPKLNISADSICNTIARENGWSERLDMSTEYNQEIDKLFNPINLRERAGYTYEYIRNRSELLSDYNGKLDAIKDIVLNNLDKKILIINKKANFASVVADYINAGYGKDIVMACHDKLDPIPALDEYGNTICIKNGVNKGKAKTLGFVSQKTKFVKMFNAGAITALSVSNSPDKDINIAIDIIIITSPFCSTIEDYIYRLSNIYFNNNRIILYTISTTGTNEFKTLLSKPVTSTHIVTNKPKNSIVSIENSDDIIVD